MHQHAYTKRSAIELCPKTYLLPPWRSSHTWFYSAPVNVSERQSMPYHRQETRTGCPPGRQSPRSQFGTTCGCQFVCCILWLARSSRCTTSQMLQPHNLYEYRVAICRIRNGRAVARRAWPSDRQSVGNARLTAQYLDRTYRMRSSAGSRTSINRCTYASGAVTGYENVPGEQ